MPSENLVATLIVCGHVLGLLLERRLHGKNLAILAAHGGVERSQRLMSALYSFWAIAVPLVVVASLIFPTRPQPLWQATGIGVVAFSQLFRRWAIHALGPYWTMGIVELRGLRPLNAGPYRLFKNPEYISRFTELVGVALATGAYSASGLCLAVASALMLKARAAEDQVLYGGHLAPEPLIE